MSKTDNAGRAYATVAETKAGDMVEVDGDFDCIADGAIVEVKDGDGSLYIDCRHGRHGLDGQIKGDVYLGLYPVKAIA